MTGTMIATTTIVLLAVIQGAMCNVIDPGDFFPNVKDNLMKIEWAHAVNNQTKLNETLSSAKVMMLEADVTLGKLNSTDLVDIPIMAHPPNILSDLSLENFFKIINSSTLNGKKGVKLDFKSIEAFEKSKEILKSLQNNIKFPIFLNADILPGPVNATTTPVDAKEFLKGAAEIMPSSILSVGWTTRYGKEFNITEGRYSKEDMMKMLSALKENNVSQPITYPVRAGLAANDIEVVKTLLRNTTFTNATLTIWSSEGDFVNVTQLSKLIQDVGLNKVYVDVPEKLKSKLEEQLGPSAASIISTANLLAVSLALLLFTRML